MDDEHLKYRYSSDWTDKLENQKHWNLYWHQQRLIHNYIKPGNHLLEIGPGNGFTTNLLRNKGFQVTTLDIDENKKPDICANIVEYQFTRNYDHILGFEIFEHIPFEEFLQVLSKLNSVCNNYLFISLPLNVKIWLRFSLKTPRFQIRNFQITTIRNKILVQNHHWELDHYKTKRKKVEKEFNRLGFFIEKKQKVLNYYFYILSAK